MMRNGQDPRRPAPRLGEGMTLREGLELHVGNMKKKGRSERSIHTIETEIPRLLKEWLDRPLVELSAIELQRVVDRILRDTKPRKGSNNAPGAALANRLIAQVSAIWNAVDKLHELPGRNPARKLTMHSLKPRT